VRAFALLPLLAGCVDRALPLPGLPDLATQPDLSIAADLSRPAPSDLALLCPTGPGSLVQGKTPFGPVDLRYAIARFEGGDCYYWFVELAAAPGADPSVTVTVSPLSDCDVSATDGTQVKGTRLCGIQNLMLPDPMLADGVVSGQLSVHMDGFDLDGFFVAHHCLMRDQYCIN
jgi:hypothetical protein